MVSEASTGLIGRFGCTSELMASGLRPGIHHNTETLRDLFGKAYGIVGLYHPMVGLRREEDGTGIGGGPRGRGSFVAYVGGDASVHTTGPEEKEGGISVVSGNTVVHGNAARKWQKEDGKALEEERLSTTATSGGGNELEEDHGKETVGTAGVACMDLVPFRPFRETKHEIESQTEEDEESERYQLHANQSGDAPKRAQAAGSTNCRDCGNQAKKDCQHERCRTCCRSHGFTCPTHVKSTWVPAIKRREKQMASAARGALRPRPKRFRSGMEEMDALNGAATSLTPTSAGTSPRDSEINSGNRSQHVIPCSTLAVLGDDCSGADLKQSLPPEIRAQAVFKCVRVTGVQDEQAEFAYQATVKIGGHLFKGVLYDQGPDNVVAVMNVTELHIGGKGIPSTSALINPSGMYESSGGTLLGGNVP
eukprot:c24293_g1_i1 orf=625-1887(+)